MRNDVIWFSCSVNRIERAASGRIIGRQFLVSSGSHVQNLMEGSSLKRDKTAFELRNKLEANGIIRDGAFTTDYVFDSPSVALKVITATSRGNLKEWTDSGDKTITKSWNAVSKQTPLLVEDRSRRGQTDPKKYE